MKTVKFRKSMMGNIPQYFCACHLGNAFCNEDHSGTYYPAAEVDVRIKVLEDALKNAKEVVTVEVVS